MDNKLIRKLAEDCGFMEFEPNIFEANMEDLKLFAEKVLDIEAKECFTAYGKKEDWE